MGRVLRGHPLVAGSAEGSVLRSEVPLSFWGGVDSSTGRIIDRRHDRSGESLAGRVLLLPGEKGSSTASAVLVELIRRNVAPAAILTTATVPVLALGSIVAGKLYDRRTPIVLLSSEDAASIREGDCIVVEPNGTVRMMPSA